MAIKGNRTELLLKHASKSQLGLEIGPYVNPLAPKSEGYNVKILDVFDQETLLSRASKDPYLSNAAIDRIESVDFVCGASEIGELVSLAGNELDYILSSHNLEHIPDPIRFLKGCLKILKPDGVLSMALPDFRGCWDRFRPLTCTADWLEAFFQKRTKPTAKQVFVQNSMHCRWQNDGVELPTMPLSTKVEELKPLETMERAYENYLKFSETEDEMPYLDTHCWTFMPSSFSLLVEDLRHLALIEFKVMEITETLSSEFIVHLKKKPFAEEDRMLFYENRASLLRGVAAYYEDQLPDDVTWL